MGALTFCNVKQGWEKQYVYIYLQFELGAFQCFKLLQFQMILLIASVPKVSILNPPVIITCKDKKVDLSLCLTN
jgi:hypothetical protein